MQTSNLATILYGVLSAAHLAVLLLWPHHFELWQIGTMLSGAAILAVLALTKGEL